MVQLSEKFLLPLDDAQAADPQQGLALVGGKGMNLARLARAGLPVPGGFLLTTQAYREFVEANHLRAPILEAAADGAAMDAAALEAASARIRGLFSAGTMPEHTAGALREAYHSMGGGAVGVAVRSSATAEDLPDLSFAGQQDTFLNVRGEDALLRAVVDCWSSLWTARAIGYRARNRVSQEDAALAVVVQAMVEAEVSGVLFTANPLTGARDEVVINAAYGLGEALVSGRVEPDQYVVKTQTGSIARRLGAKALSLHGRADGGLAEVQSARGAQQALSNQQIIALTRLAERVAGLYGAPQDIEFAWADGQFYLLQSRPVTSLFPIPEGSAPEPLEVFFAFSAVQGLMAPITPLGRSVLQYFFAMAGRLYRIYHTGETQRVGLAGGERLWMNITPLVRNSIGRKIVTGALSFVEPGARQALMQVIDDPRLQPGRKGVRPRTALRLLYFAVPTVGNMIHHMAAPERRRRYMQAFGERTIREFRARCASIQGDPYQRVKRLIAEFENTSTRVLPRRLRLFVSGVAAGIASFNLLGKLAEQIPGERSPSGGWPRLLLETTRGLPDNPTTEMDLRLWDVARQIGADPALRQAFEASAPGELAARYSAARYLAARHSAARHLEDRGTPGAVLERLWPLIDGFMEQYGARGLAEIDLGRAPWHEEPQHIFEVLAGYLKISDPAQAPDAVFIRGAQAAEAAVERIVRGLAALPHGAVKARLARFLARRARALLSFREYPKFFVVRLMDCFRSQLLRAGEELAAQGVLERPDDLMFFTMAELKALAARDQRDWRAIVAQRRAAYQREEQRKQIPRLLLSDGRAFYEGLVEAGADQDGRLLRGSGVSPGSVEGRVRVVMDPRHANLQPGEVMVCPGTDPAWTPLFLTAAALVMEVGGMMTHGAVVAREYGIPAVVGVDRATERLVDGQRVRVDGAAGLVTLLEAG